MHIKKIYRNEAAEKKAGGRLSSFYKDLDKAYYFEVSKHVGTFEELKNDLESRNYFILPACYPDKKDSVDLNKALLQHLEYNGWTGFEFDPTYYKEDEISSGKEGWYLVLYVDGYRRE